MIEGGTRHRHRAGRRPHRARQAVRRLHDRRASDLREPDRPRAAAGSVPARSSTASSTPPGRCSACISRCNESPRFAAEKFDPNINRALKWSIGAETMEDLFAAHQDVQAGRVPKLVQFGSGPLSLLDPTQAPPGKHTTYCLARDAARSRSRRARATRISRRNSPTRSSRSFARYCPNMTSKNIIGRYVYTGARIRRRK